MPLAYIPRVLIEWDEAKNVASQRKHRISLEGARQLFESGADFFDIFDRDHSESEDRFVSIGPISRGLVLVVFTELENDTIRILSAQLAKRREQALYRTQMERN